jgi:histidinol phosphatase-like PHP family hydrolase
MANAGNSRQNTHRSTLFRPDVNVEVAGLLLDMSALQKTKPSGLGYKRAAYAVFSLERPVSESVAAGTLRKIRGIGPSSERIIQEWIGAGTASRLLEALEGAPVAVRAEVEKRRAVREGFLSWSGVLAALRAKRSADVVAPSRYRGDLQMHTTWSDGAEDLQTMAAACLVKGWTRMCVTDHSYGLPVARGMTMDRASGQHAAIDRLNVAFGGAFRIFKGIEANILVDGRVDMQPNELRRFELVIASPHSALRKPDDQTRRMVAAVETRGVHILGHPRGRMFNRRAGIRADWPRVFAAAARANVAIELDGPWDRQDIDADLAALAVDEGCLFAIDSDAHSTLELVFVDYAMAHARLADIPTERVINCWDDERLMEWAKR